MSIPTVDILKMFLGNQELKQYEFLSINPDKKIILKSKEDFFEIRGTVGTTDPWDLDAGSITTKIVDLNNP